MLFYTLLSVFWQRFRELKRSLILEAMRAACKEQNVTLDRELPVCMSAISKAVVAAESTSAAGAVPEDLPEAIARGKSAYTTGQCARCHRAIGRGAPIINTFSEPRAPDDLYGMVVQRPVRFHVLQFRPLQ